MTVWWPWWPEGGVWGGRGETGGREEGGGEAELPPKHLGPHACSAYPLPLTHNPGPFAFSLTC